MAGTYNKPLFEDSSSFLDGTDSFDEVMKADDIPKAVIKYMNKKNGVVEKRRLSQIWKPTGNTPPHRYNIEFTRIHDSDSSLEIIKGDGERNNSAEAGRVEGQLNENLPGPSGVTSNQQTKEKEKETEDISDTLRSMQTPSMSIEEAAIERLSAEQAQQQNGCLNLTPNKSQKSGSTISPNFHPPNSSTPVIRTRIHSEPWRMSTVPTPIHSNDVSKIKGKESEGLKNASLKTPQKYFREKIGEVTTTQSKQPKTPSRIPIHATTPKTPKYVPVQPQFDQVRTPVMQTKPNAEEPPPVHQTVTKPSNVTININCNIEPTSSKQTAFEKPLNGEATTKKMVENEPITEDAKSAEPIVHSTTNKEREAINLITDDEDDDDDVNTTPLKQTVNCEVPKSPSISHANCFKEQSLRRQLFTPKSKQLGIERRHGSVTPTKVMEQKRSSRTTSKIFEQQHTSRTPTKINNSSRQKRATSQPLPVTSSPKFIAYKCSRPRSKNFYEINENEMNAGAVGGVPINNHTFDVIKDPSVASQQNNNAEVTNVEFKKRHSQSCPQTPISFRSDVADLPSDAILNSLSLHISVNKVIENAPTGGDNGNDDDDDRRPSSSMMTDDQSNTSNKENAPVENLDPTIDNMKQLSVQRLPGSITETAAGYSAIREDASYGNIMVPIEFRDEEVIEDRSPGLAKAIYEHVISIRKSQQSIPSADDSSGRRKRNSRKKTNPEAIRIEAELSQLEVRKRVNTDPGSRNPRRLYVKGHSDLELSGDEYDSCQSDISQKKTPESVSSQQAGPSKTHSKPQTQDQANSPMQFDTKTQDKATDPRQNESNEQNQTEKRNQNEADANLLKKRPKKPTVREISVQTGDSLRRSSVAANLPDERETVNEPENEPENTQPPADDVAYGDEIYIPETQEIPNTEEPPVVEEMPPPRPVSSDPKSKNKEGRKPKASRANTENTVVDDMENDDNGSIENGPRRSKRGHNNYSGWTLLFLKQQKSLCATIYSKAQTNKKTSKNANKTRSNNTTVKSTSRNTQAVQHNDIDEVGHTQHPKSTRGRSRNRSVDQPKTSQSTRTTQDINDANDEVQQPKSSRDKSQKTNVGQPTTSKNSKRKTTVASEHTDEPAEKTKKSNTNKRTNSSAGGAIENTNKNRHTNDSNANGSKSRNSDRNNRNNSMVASSSDRKRHTHNAEVPDSSTSKKSRGSKEVPKKVNEPVKQSTKSNNTKKSKTRLSVEEVSSIQEILSQSSVMNLTTEQEDWFAKALDPNFDINVLSNKRTEADLRLINVGDKQIEKTQFGALRFHNVNGVEIGFFPTHNEKASFGIMRFLPHSKKPKTFNESVMIFLILSGSYLFKMGRKSQAIEGGGAVKVPAGEPFEIVSTSDEVGLMQFLMVDEDEEEE